MAPAPRKAPGNAAAGAAAPKLDPFWDQAELKKAWDLAGLKTQDEIRLGGELSDLILQLNPPVKTGQYLRRVEEVAEPLLKMRLRKDIEYQFFVLDSDAAYAFSTPGGFVYVSRGLFNLIGEDEDYALEFVLGHEIAHVDLQHALKCLRDPGVMGLAGGTLQKLYLLILPYGYPDAMEFEADSRAYAWMRQVERTDREALAFLRKFVGYAEAHGFQDGRGKPEIGPRSSQLENHFRAHTAAWKRLKHLEPLTGKAANPAK